jgi:endonuclease YncB( thermonuclease family)
MNKVAWFAVTAFAALLPANVLAQRHETTCARCTGSSLCRACTNCSRCAHCGAGGTCGVCAGTSSGRSSSGGSSGGGSSRSSSFRVSPTPKPAPTPKPTPAPLPNTFTARVVGISDGDTITVVTASQRSVKIRLHGVDAPEKAQPYGQAAKQTLSNYVFQQRVIVKRQTVDQYGRLVAVVTPEGKSESANERQLKEGMAWWYKQYAPSNTKFEQLQSEAKTAKRGLWKDENPTPPWEFRRENQ